MVGPLRAPVIADYEIACLRIGAVKRSKCAARRNAGTGIVPGSQCGSVCGNRGCCYPNQEAGRFAEAVEDQMSVQFGVWGSHYVSVAERGSQKLTDGSVIPGNWPDGSLRAS